MREEARQMSLPYDTCKTVLYTHVICPKCGALMKRTGSQPETVVCAGRWECELAGVLFEAPSVELKRFIANSEPGRLPERPDSPSASR